MTSRGSLVTAALDDHSTEVAIIDAVGDIVYTNHAWREFGEDNGLPAADMIGVNYLSAVEAADDEHAERAASGLHELLDDERETFELEYPCHSPDEQRWFQMWASAFTHDGERYVLIEHLDVTERVLAERTVEEQNERLEMVAQVLSHDLRNPLSIAIGYAELLADGEESDPDAILSALERMQRIIDDALIFARDDAEIDRESISIEAVANDAWETVDTRNASLEVVDGLTVRADASLLRNVFENLFRNSVEHGGPSVAIRVGATADGFYVQDDGPGIPSEEHDRIFEAGHSGGNSTGFGLAIVRHIVEAHGWEIEAVSNPDGARFEVNGVELSAEHPA